MSSFRVIHIYLLIKTLQNTNIVRFLHKINTQKFNNFNWMDERDFLISKFQYLLQFSLVKP